MGGTFFLLFFFSLAGWYFKGVGGNSPARGHSVLNIRGYRLLLKGINGWTISKIPSNCWMYCVSLFFFSWRKNCYSLRVGFDPGTSSTPSSCSSHLAVGSSLQTVGLFHNDMFTTTGRIRLFHNGQPEHTCSIQPLSISLFSLPSFKRYGAHTLMSKCYWFSSHPVSIRLNTYVLLLPPNEF